MTAEKTGPDRPKIPYMISGIKLINTTTVNKNMNKIDSPLSFGYVFSSSRQYDSFEEAMGSYRQAPNLIAKHDLIDKQKDSSIQLDSQVAKTERKKNPLLIEDLGPLQTRSSFRKQQEQQQKQQKQQQQQQEQESAQASDEVELRVQKQKQKKKQPQMQEQEQKQEKWEQSEQEQRNIYPLNVVPTDEKKQKSTTAESNIGTIVNNELELANNNLITVTFNKTIDNSKIEDNHCNVQTEAASDNDEQYEVLSVPPSSPLGSQDEALLEMLGDLNSQLERIDYPFQLMSQDNDHTKTTLHIPVKVTDTTIPTLKINPEQNKVNLECQELRPGNSEQFSSQGENVNEQTGLIIPSLQQTTDRETEEANLTGSPTCTVLTNSEQPSTLINPLCVTRTPGNRKDEDKTTFKELNPEADKPVFTRHLTAVGNNVEKRISDGKEINLFTKGQSHFDNDNNVTDNSVHKRNVKTVKSHPNVIDKEESDSSKNCHNSDPEKYEATSNSVRREDGQADKLREKETRQSRSKCNSYTSTDLYNSNIEYPTQQYGIIRENAEESIEEIGTQIGRPIDNRTVEMEQIVDASSLQMNEIHDNTNLSAEKSNGPRKKLSTRIVGQYRNADSIELSTKVPYSKTKFGYSSSPADGNLVVDSRLFSIPELRTSTVSVIPNAKKRIVENNYHGNTTLLKKLEPPEALSAESFSVFSGPRYFPEKYQIKPLADLDTSFFKQARPSINSFFQAALEDGSFFDQYEGYHENDPVNFRHAYKTLSSSVSNAITTTPEKYVERQTTGEEKAAPVRRWYKPASPNLAPPAPESILLQDDVLGSPLLSYQEPLEGMSVFENTRTKESNPFFKEYNGSEENYSQSYKHKRLQRSSSPLASPSRKKRKLKSLVNWPGFEESETDSLPEGDEDYQVDENEVQESTAIKCKPENITKKARYNNIGAEADGEYEEEVDQLNEDEEYVDSFVFEDLPKPQKAQKKRGPKPKKAVEIEKKKRGRKAKLPNEKKPIYAPARTKLKDLIVLPSDDLICSICLQHEFPKETWDKLNLRHDYLQFLEDTKDKRKPGHTGSNHFWDPRVFIKCSECASILHCGCPYTPIKSYPSRGEKFVCVQCDTTEDPVAVKAKRAKKSINYKV